MLDKLIVDVNDKKEKISSFETLNRVKACVLWHIFHRQISQLLSVVRLLFCPALSEYLLQSTTKIEYICDNIYDVSISIWI